MERKGPSRRRAVGDARLLVQLANARAPPFLIWESATQLLLASCPGQPSRLVWRCSMALSLLPLLGTPYLDHKVNSSAFDDLDLPAVTPDTVTVISFQLSLIILF